MERMGIVNVPGGSLSEFTGPAWLAERVVLGVLAFAYHVLKRRWPTKQKEMDMCQNREVLLLASLQPNLKTGTGSENTPGRFSGVTCCKVQAAQPPEGLGGCGFAPCSHGLQHGRGSKTMVPFWGRCTTDSKREALARKRGIAAQRCRFHLASC